MEKREGWRPDGHKFVTATLPKEIYLKLRDIKDAHDISPRDVVVLGVMCICAAGKADPAKVQAMVDRIKSTTGTDSLL